MKVGTLMNQAKKKIDALDAKIFATEIFKLSSAELITQSEKTLCEAEIETFWHMVHQRMQGHSVSELLQKRDFYGRTFWVTNDVLTPRPETEWIVTFAKKNAENVSQFIDMGTGSGCIAISIAAETQKKTLAIDVCEKALHVAKTNATTHHTEHLISFCQSNLFENIAENTVHHAGVCANLPYIPSGDALDKEVILGDPALALFSGTDGLDLYREFFAKIPDGFAFCAFEFHPPQKEELQKIITTRFPKKNLLFYSDLAGDIRFGVVE